jgi:hypothetical protein
MELQIYPQDYRITILFNNPYPFPEEQLIEILSKKGFSEIKDIPKIMGTPPLQVIRATVVRKGDNEVLYNPDKGYLGIIGLNFKEVNDDFEILESTIKSELGIEKSAIKSAELISSNRVYSINAPLEVISRFLESANFSKFKEVLGEDIDIKPFTVRMYINTEISGSINTLSNWADLTIEPFIPNPKYYLVRLIYRNTDNDNVKEVAKKLDKIILNSIRLIEG